MTSIDVRDRAALADASGAVCGDAVPLRTLVWAAGRFDWGPTARADVSAIDDALDVSLASAIVTTRLLLPTLLEHAPSSIVLIGSIAGRQAFANNAAHVAAKHGLRGFAEALQLEVAAAGVAVTTISAGLVLAGAGRAAPEATEHPEALLAVDDIAGAVAYAIDAPTHARPTEIVLRPALG